MLPLGEKLTIDDLRRCLDRDAVVVGREAIIPMDERCHFRDHVKQNHPDGNSLHNTAWLRESHLCGVIEPHVGADSRGKHNQSDARDRLKNDDLSRERPMQNKRIQGDSAGHEREETCGHKGELDCPYKLHRVAGVAAAVSTHDIAEIADYGDDGNKRDQGGESANPRDRRSEPRLEIGHQPRKHFVRLFHVD
ncbi:MAG: hypothetical protein ABL953_03135 [Ilumatobacteraceae bacterium]